VSFAAITHDKDAGENRLEDLASFNLRLTADRLKLFKHLIKLRGLLTSLNTIVRGHQESEFAELQRSNGTTVAIGAKLIRKTFNSVEKVKHLRDIYTRLRKKGVPHTDSFLNVVPGNACAVNLGPRGDNVTPQGREEIRDAVQCVLQALEAMHRQPSPLYHRDIRWPNIVRELGELGETRIWFLIDWDDATTPPTKARPNLQADTHHPAIAHDGHGAEVDIWAVGELIKEAHRSQWGATDDDMIFAERLTNGEITSASEALATWKTMFDDQN